MPYVEAADQTVQLAKVTPHRVMRELYEQFISYSRAYVDAVPTYTERQTTYLVGVSEVLPLTPLTRICTSIAYGACQGSGPTWVLAPPASEGHRASLSDPNSPQQFPRER